MKIRILNNNTSCDNHAEHDAKYSANKRLRDGDQQGSEFGNGTKKEKDRCCALNHSTTSNLLKNLYHFMKALNPYC